MFSYFSHLIIVVINAVEDFNKVHGLKTYNYFNVYEIKNYEYKNNIHIHVMINNTSKLYSPFFNPISSLS